MTFTEFKDGVIAAKGTYALPDEAELKRAWQLDIDPTEYWHSWIQLAMYNGEQSGAERMILAHESLKLQRRLVEAVEKLANKPDVQFIGTALDLMQEKWKAAYDKGFSDGFDVH